MAAAIQLGETGMQLVVVPHHKPRTHKTTLGRSIDQRRAAHLSSVHGRNNDGGSQAKHSGSTLERARTKVLPKATDAMMRKIIALRQVSVERGSSAAEAANAEALSLRLMARYGVEIGDLIRYRQQIETSQVDAWEIWDAAVATLGLEIDKFGGRGAIRSCGLTIYVQPDQGWQVTRQGRQLTAGTTLHGLMQFLVNGGHRRVYSMTRVA